MIVWAMGSVGVALLAWLCFADWLDEVPPRRIESMPEPLQPPSPPTVPVLALPPALADALARMQGTHATAAIKWAAHQAAMADSIAATAAKVEARKQLHAMIDQQFPD